MLVQCRATLDRNFRTFLLFTRRKLRSQHSRAWHIGNGMFRLSKQTENTHDRSKTSAIATRKVFLSLSNLKARKCKDYSDNEFYLHPSHRRISAYCNFSETDFSQYAIRKVKIVTRMFRLEHKSQFVQE